MTLSLAASMLRRITVCALTMGPVAAIAQENSQENPVSALDEIVVTATRVDTIVRDLARAISVVDKERIQNGTQQLALDEALAGVPGLYMQNRYNFAQDLRVSLRGFGARSASASAALRSSWTGSRRLCLTVRPALTASISDRRGASKFCAVRRHRCMATLPAE